MKPKKRKFQNLKPKSDIWIDYVGNGQYSLFCQVDPSESRPLATSKNPRDLINYAYTFVGDFHDFVDLSDSVRLILNLYHMENSENKKLD